MIYEDLIEEWDKFFEISVVMNEEVDLMDDDEDGKYK